MWGNTFPAILGRWALFAGRVLLVGAWGFRWMVGRSGKRGPGASSRPELAAAGDLALVGGGLLVGGVVLRLLMQVLDFVEPSEPLGEQLRFLIVQLFWGRIWMLQAALALVALILLPWLLRREGGGNLVLGGLVVLPLAWTPALSGHAIGSERFTSLAVAADGLHVLGSGLWLGTLCVMLVALLRIPEGGEREETLREWMEPFHRLAMVCVGVVVVTGAFAMWLHAGSPAVLFRSDWGFALLAKLGAVAVVLGMGWRSGWRLRPRLHEPGAPGKLTDSAMLELLVAQLVLLLTAALVALSPVVMDH